MRTRTTVLGVAVIIGVVVFAILKPARVPVFAQLTKQHRPRPQMPTITTLPDFPGIPLFPRILTKERQKELRQTLINNKIHTYPMVSSRDRKSVV